MPKILQPRLPFEPLARFVAGDRPLARECTEGYLKAHDTDAVSDRILAFHLGTNARQVQRWWHEGILSDLADDLVIKLGAHPSVVWPQYHNITYLYDQDMLTREKQLLYGRRTERRRKEKARAETA